jgi:hypothetical protein
MSKAKKKYVLKPKIYTERDTIISYYIYRHTIINFIVCISGVVAVIQTFGARLIPAYQWVNIVKFWRDRGNEFPMFLRLN